MADDSGDQRATDKADDHAGIPRDARGVPVFFILPPAIRARYDDKMARLERAWQSTHDPRAVAEAHTWCRLHRQPPSLWLDEAVWIVATARTTKGHAKRALKAAIHLARYEAVRDAKTDGLRWLRQWAENAERAARAARARVERAEHDAKRRTPPQHERTHRARHVAKRRSKYAARFREEVERAVKRGSVTWEQAKKIAVIVVAGTDAATRKPKTTIWKSYKRVKSDLKTGRVAKYFIPRTPGGELGDSIKRNASARVPRKPRSGP